MIHTRLRGVLHLPRRSLIYPISDAIYISLMQLYFYLLGPTDYINTDTHLSLLRLVPSPQSPSPQSRLIIQRCLWNKHSLCHLFRLAFLHRHIRRTRRRTTQTLSPLVAGPRYTLFPHINNPSILPLPRILRGSASVYPTSWTLIPPGGSPTDTWYHGEKMSFQQR